jgi:hypothetical protein
MFTGNQDDKINVYDRADDGLLHFVKTVRIDNDEEMAWLTDNYAQRPQ